MKKVAYSTLLSMLVFFPILIFADSGVLDGQDPKPIDEFVKEQSEPKEQEKSLTVTGVDTYQRGRRKRDVVVRLSDGTTFKVRPTQNDQEKAQAWAMTGPVVEVIHTRSSEGYPYLIKPTSGTKADGVYAKPWKPRTSQ